ncbi:GatB/YqeY domain-containing protein [Limosilactobacillus equigenerosi]|uniref:GatB Yqey domain-containing protein n=1 Tax=Limosilactobacillus equigenerosi DSM 18793 = JCM 14505 TaxID=1423742 RepID=A0A0R1ULT0_9LACO|nr:GatB/YqeY domain-containing protein [Limosilactobacillus equigenerosi]KRL92248.1 GatB Yqey domain-containing protein [Limosilactobacillus equigenerosi DSM 18793 = JCM 14505]
MSLLDQLNNDMKTAMKAKDKATLSVVRMLKAAVTNEQINLGHDLTADEEATVLSREYKQRKESLAEFENAGREDLIEQAKHELSVVEKYLPEQLSEAEVKAIVTKAIEQTGAESMKDMGKVMGVVMPQVKGKADGKLVNETVKAALQ